MDADRVDQVDRVDQDVATALAEQHDELAGLLAPLGEVDWALPSRCDGWSVADVVLHLAQTDELAVASLQDRLAERAAELAGVGAGGGAPALSSVDDFAASLVDRQRGAPGAVVGERWATGARELRSLVAAADPHRRVAWVAGELSVRTLATTRLAECWIHTGDVAAALGATLLPPDRLRHVARLAWRTLPYAFAQAGRELAGPVAFDLTGPGGDPWRLVPPGGMPATTTVRGPGAELCLVAARRVEPGDTSLVTEGPDGAAVLELVRTYA